MNCFCTKITLFLAFLVIPTWALAVQVQLTPVADTTLYEDGDGALANGSGDYLFFGKVGTTGGEELRRALVKFDVSSIPAEAIINQVSVSFEINQAPSPSSSGTAALHRVLASWGEGASQAPGQEGTGGAAQPGDATWVHRQFPGSNWSTVGGDFDPTASATKGYGFGPEPLVFDSTEQLRTDVRMWISNPSTNHGWILLGNEAAVRSARRVYARESIGSAVPQLTVDFTVPSPLDNLDLTEIASGLSRPVTIANANDGTGRLFIVEQTGKIRIFDTQTQSLLGGTYLDISSLIWGGGQFSEQGLLGLAFHPGFASNRKFYVYYIRRPVSGADRSVLAMGQQDSGTPNSATLVSTIMEFEQNAANHNGGDLHFGEDGYLYISSGDGGGSGDLYRNAQDVDTLKGAILRIDVDGTPGSGGTELCGLVKNYAIPPGNAFPGATDGCDEILHLGLRNPWKFSFDALTGGMYIGDVGQGEWEEVDYAAPGTSGLNFGWPCREGSNNYPSTPSGVSCPNPVEPIFDYSSGSAGTGNCSVTGGYVYRGSLAAIYGYYVYGDYCSDRIWIARNEAGGWTSTLWTDAAPTLSSISAFGQDERCELYVADLDAGKIFRIDDTGQIYQGGFESLHCQ
jgi:glucose/arabinose dehydrogenase